MPDSIDSDLVLENLGLALLVVDHRMQILRVNLSAETLFGQSRRVLLNAKLTDIIQLEMVDRCIRDCFDNYAQFSLREVAINIADSEVLVDIALSSFTSGTHGSLVLIEISSIHRISRFIKEQNQLERQQSFKLMMRGLAHEIKNPLGGIRGAAQLLDRELDQPEHQELTNILIKEADRLTHLVDRVMGSREQLKLQSINIHEVLEHVIHLVNVENNQKLVVERFYDPALPEIIADKGQLIQAVLNIVGNAIQAQEGLLIAKIGLVTQFERFVTINQIMHRQVLKLSIWDDGPGVAEEMRDILFDPLITGRPDGTGLGLSITQEIIQRHLGSVLLEDWQGKTCLAVYLPYAIDTEDGS